MVETLAVIPAKSSSRRLPNKNVRKLAGAPLLKYSVEIALASDAIDRVCVDTDHQQIQRMARRWGASAPTLRPDKLSEPEVHAAEVVLHRLREYRRDGTQPDIVMMLLPTNPFRRLGDIEEAVRMVERDRDCPVVSVSALGKGMPHLKRIVDGRIQDVHAPPAANFQTDDVETLYALNGSVYAADEALFRREGTFHTDSRNPLIMPPRAGIDIDEHEDFSLAEDVMLTLKNTSRPGYEWLDRLDVEGPPSPGPDRIADSRET